MDASTLNKTFKRPIYSQKKISLSSRSDSYKLKSGVHKNAADARKNQHLRYFGAKNQRVIPSHSQIHAPSQLLYTFTFVFPLV